MLKRFLTLCLAVLLMVGAVFAAMPGTRAAEEESDIRSLLDALPMNKISYSYNDNTTSRSASVWFSPALLLLDSRDFSGEMAKASVALAMAAYSETHVDSILLNMGFTASENTDVYARSENDLTMADNDRVAYTIAYQDVTHPVTAEVYRIYCVPIKGTTANAEWFSDFNMGTGVEHEGFRKASEEVYDAMKAEFAKDGMDADHRIVWLTGHSRGAACANLIAGWLSKDAQYASAERVFGYTYACPGVSVNADTALTNIYNFNNPGDLVTMLPLKEWGFDRNGQTVMLDTSAAQLENVRIQFKNTFYADYAAETTDENLKALLLDIFGDDRDAYNSSTSMKMTLSWVAYLMGGKNDASVSEVLEKNDVAVSDTVAANIIDGSLPSTVTNLNRTYNYYTQLWEWVCDAYEETSAMTEDEFKTFLSRNSAKISELTKVTSVEITGAADLDSARKVLDRLNAEITSLLACMETAIDLVLNEKGNVKDPIIHGYTQSAYTVWINSLYYGHRGWYNNPQIQSLSIDESVLSVGDSCFYGCSGLNELTIPDAKVILDRHCFGNCHGLRTVTLPVDYDYTNSPFHGSSASYNTDGVTTIHYTCGQTGIMPDRSSSGNSVQCYNKTLEYASRSSIQSIDFEAGITHIGNYFVYPGSSSLQTVKLPTTVTTIGDRAFYGCTVLSDIDFHEGLTSLGNEAFQNCDGLTSLTIPKSMQTVGNSTFFGCDGIVELTIPDTTVALGSYAFGNCKGLRTVTLPVDYDFSKNPFGGSSASYYTDGVTTIHYTFGQTGVMPDRSSSGNSTQCYNKTLEFASRNSIQSIGFEEGIVNIGSYLFYPSSTALTEVKLPASMKTIGDYAFYSSTALPGITFNEGLVSLGNNTFYNCDSLRDLPAFPGSLTTIGSNTFADCDGLTALTIPEGVTSIGSYAFNGCDGLVELTLPDTTVTLGSYAFGNCKGLRTVTLPVDYDTSNQPFGGNSSSQYTDGVTTIHYTCGQNGIMPDRVSSNSSSLTFSKSLEYASRNSLLSIDFEEGITHIGSYLCYPGSSSLTEVKLPSTMESISGSAFYACTALPGIDFNEGLVSLGDSAFYGCKSFTALPTFPDSLTTIGNSTFADCDGLTELTIPQSVTAIGSRAFFGCSGLETLTIPDITVTLGSYAFGNCAALHTVTLPVDYDLSNHPFGAPSVSEYTDGVTAIHFTCGQTGVMPDRNTSSSSAVAYQKSLEHTSRNSVKTVDFEEGITNIGAYLFGNGSTTLTEVKLPTTVEVIGDRAFYSCTALAKIDFPAALKRIGSYAFYNCDSFTKLPQLPGSLTAIGSQAFFDCDGLVELTLPDTPIALGSYAFGGCDNLRTVTLPVDYDISNHPFGASSVGYYTSGVTTVHFTCGQTGVMPDRVYNGSTSAVYYTKSLEYVSRNSIQTIDFAEGITQIGAYFIGNSSSSLQTVNFPSTLRSIGTRAFTACTADATVTFTGNAPTIAADAFKDTTATCYYPAWDKTWTDDVMQNYGGTLTWIPYRKDVVLSGQGFSLSFEDEVLVNFYYAVDDTVDVAEQGMLVFYTKPDVADIENADVVYDQPYFDAANDRYLATTTGIAAKEMGDTRYYAAYAKRSDGVYFYSNVYEYSPKKYAMNMLGRDSTSDKQKALCVSMLNYGAAAQNYFGYRTDDLMNADLTAEQKALVMEYDRTLFIGAVAADPGKTGTFARTDSFDSKSVTVSFEGAFAINYYFVPGFDVKGDMRLCIWTPEAYASAAQLTEENASAVITMTEQASGAYWAQVSGIAAKMLDKTYYVAGVYTDEDGNTHCTGVIAYSLSRYCMNNAGGNMGELAQATAMYGYYAESYFA